MSEMEQKFPIENLSAKTKVLDLGAGTTVHHLPDWAAYDDPKKLAVLREIAEKRGRDPRIAKLAVSIIKKAKIQPRDYKGQAAALLAWVQDPQNVYYVNEPGERLQDPIFTIKNGFGDCDDQNLVLCSLFESVKLPWKYVISGRNRSSGEKVRYIEGEKYPQNCEWTHIYCIVGTPPFTPNLWYFCECTVQGVPLGWDVISGDHSFLPEMVKNKKGPQKIMDLGIKAPAGFKPIDPPKNKQWSPAYAAALDAKGNEYYGDAFTALNNPNNPNNSIFRTSSYAGSGSVGGIGASVGSSIAGEMLDSGQSSGANRPNSKWLDFKKVSQAVVTGVTISVITQLILDYVRKTGRWAPSGSQVKDAQANKGRG